MTLGSDPGVSDGPAVHRPVLHRHRLLDTYLDAYTVPTLLDDIEAAAAIGGRWLIANHNVNSLTLMQRDATFRAFFDRADRIFLDGVGALMVAKVAGAGLQQEHRVAVLDWIWPLCARAEERGWSLVHLGGTGEGLARARRAMLDRHPRLDLTTVDGFFDVDDDQQVAAVLAEIARARPTVLLVGMGMPRQELWLDRHLADLPPTVVITVGGILSFLGGERPTPPRWLGRLGIEWVYRLVTEPRRLWRRYLVEPVALLPAVAREVRRRTRR
jgi:N-acetylglucosaminyldiphosphoundecaprenol N-acetyl-beta-D-mannosaminyltransferase